MTVGVGLGGGGGGGRGILKTGKVPGEEFSSSPLLVPMVIVSGSGSDFGVGNGGGGGGGGIPCSGEVFLTFLHGGELPSASSPLLVPIVIVSGGDFGVGMGVVEVDPGNNTD
jgi:hypothetical protein